MKPTTAAPQNLDALALSNVNSLWGALTAEVLYRLGVRHAVISPGSRSTPLTFALARHPNIEAIPILDERAAVFFALGLAKQSGVPAVFVCTSGTACANAFPAVIEAAEGGTPLLVLTTDRPPEMRQCNSGQTIDQIKLFGDYVRHFAEMPLPEAQPGLLRHLRQSLVYAVGMAQAPDPGPVQLNFPFRDPLPPQGDSEPVMDVETVAGIIGGVHASVATRLELSGSFPTLPKKGLLIAGAQESTNTAREAKSLARMARGLGWPILADALGSWRNFERMHPYLVTHFDTILRAEKADRRLVPECVICVGTLPTSRVLRNWLEQNNVRTYIVSPRPRNNDPLHRDAVHVGVGLHELSKQYKGETRKAGNFFRRWLEAEAQVERGIEREFKQIDFLFEGAVARELSQNLPPEAPLFVANSMPVRDLEYFWKPQNLGTVIYCNRGANGIDGTLSTALGVVHGRRFGVLLTGDLAFLHDLSGLLVGGKLKGHLTVILINNHGGGIFESLPVSAYDPPFEDFFATPQDIDIPKLCESAGASHMHVARLSDLGRLLRSMPETGVRVLEIQTDRKRDQAFRRSVFKSIAAQLKFD